MVVLATLRAHLRDEFSARYDPSRAQDDRLIAQAGREVFDAVSMEIRLGRVWSPAELARARESTDPRIAQAVRAADRHGVAETIAARSPPRLMSGALDITGRYHWISYASYMRCI